MPSSPPTRAEHEPLFVVRRPVAVDVPDTCHFIGLSDVFRLSEKPSGLLAGCAGDFDGDGQKDYALLMRDKRDAVAKTFVFQSRGKDFQVTQIGVARDRYGYDEDKSI
jgi:hypothetical protein